MKNQDKISHLLERNTADIVVKSHLEKALASKKKLRVKHGIDPTGPKIHLGRAVVLWKLREFQELGHQIVLIIGDYTAQIGDPSDKLEKRPFLTEQQIQKNLKTYKPQIGKILDLQKTEIRHNSEWLAQFSFRQTSELADLFTFQQILERENFAKRLKSNQPIYLGEGLYPLMQGYDSVAVRADLELGGTDQLFNLLAGRKIQEFYKQKPQDIMTTKMLLGTDGRKMSTSWGNVINIADDPSDMYGKVMAMRDEEMFDYFYLATDKSEKEIMEISAELKKAVNPKIIKQDLAFAITARYHGKADAVKAAQEFEKVFKKKGSPSLMPVLKLRSGPVSLLELVVQSGIRSRAEARRLVVQGAVKLNDAPKKSPTEEIILKSPAVLKIGKRRFFKLEPSVS